VKIHANFTVPYKLHQLIDLQYQLIRCFDVSTASRHDKNIVFTTDGIIFADKAYMGANFSSPIGFS
jgi:hypothetical protein